MGRCCCTRGRIFHSVGVVVRVGRDCDAVGKGETCHRLDHIGYFSFLLVAKVMPFYIPALATWITARTVDFCVIVTELLNVRELGDPVVSFQETFPITLGFCRRGALIQTLLHVIDIVMKVLEAWGLVRESDSL